MFHNAAKFRKSLNLPKYLPSNKSQLKKLNFNTWDLEIGNIIFYICPVNPSLF